MWYLVVYWVQYQGPFWIWERKTIFPTQHTYTLYYKNHIRKFKRYLYPSWGILSLEIAVPFLITLSLEFFLSSNVCFLSSLPFVRETLPAYSVYSRTIPESSTILFVELLATPSPDASVRYISEMKPAPCILMVWVVIRTQDYLSRPIAWFRQELTLYKQEQRKYLPSL